MSYLGQSSGGWNASSGALKILHGGIRNSVGVLTDDAFTQSNPPIVATTGTITAQVDTTLHGVLSGSVAFARGDAGGGSNYVGGPAAVGTANVAILGVFLLNANGNAFENTPGTASGKGAYASGCGTYANRLFEDAVLTGANAGNALTAYNVGQRLYASRNGYLTNAIFADYAANEAEQLWEGTLTVDQTPTADFSFASAPTVIGIVKMVPDAVQGDLVYDQRI